MKKESIHKISESPHGKKTDGKNQYQNVFEFLPTAILLLSDNGIIYNVNHKFCNLFAYSKNDLINKSVKILDYTSENRDTFIARIKKNCDKQLATILKDANGLPVEIKMDISKMPDSYYSCAITLQTNNNSNSLDEDLTKYRYTETNKWLQTIINSLHYALLSVDQDFFISDFNLAAKTIFQKLFHKKISEKTSLLHFFDKNSPVIHDLQKAFQGSRIHKDRAIPCRLSKEYWLELHISPISDSRKNINTAIITFTDIHQRKHAEQRLQKSKANLKAMFDSSYLIYNLVDKNYKILTYNKNSEHFFKKYLEKEIIAGEPILSYLPKKQSNILKNYIKRSFRGERLKKEFSYRYKDNERWFELYSLPAYGNNNQIVGVAISILDITERKLSQVRIQQSQAKLKAIFENAIQSFILLDKNMRINAFNSSAQSVCKKIYEKDLKLGIKFDECIQENHIFRRFFYKALKGNKIQREVQVEAQNGTKHWYEIHFAPIYELDKQITGVIFSTIGIDRRKRAEAEIKQSAQQLKELNATKDKLFTIIAHDLKSPFNTLLGFSELLVNEYNTMPANEVEKFHLYIYQSANQAFNLLTNLLEWAKTQTGRIKLHPVEFDLTSVIEENIRLFELRAKEKGITLKTDVKNNLQVFADQNMITLVLRNLLSNAIKFTNTEGKISLTANKKHSKDETNIHFIEVSVKDTGTGMKAADISKLFRVDVEHTTKGTHNEIGTGLGLILCKEFITKNKGEIFVESEYGKGSNFRFTIPAVM